VQTAGKRAAGETMRTRTLPGFPLSMGLTLAFLGLVVLIPLSMVLLKSTELGLGQIVAAVTSTRALAAYGLTFGASLAAALVDTVFGVVVAWVLVRYRFPGRGLLDALVDLPFAVPTAVSGIALTTLYSPSGWLGALAARAGVQTAYSRVGVTIALIFVSLPFVIRTVQPVLAELDREMEESAATLGASRLTVLVRVILPNLAPAALTGFALAFGRAIGEYGSVVFIAGNMPMRTEIAPLLIMTKLEQFDYGGATAVALVLLIVSFLLLLGVNRLQEWTRGRTGSDHR
jgi:sulfate/thiosulfate transport system permease protein